MQNLFELKVNLWNQKWIYWELVKTKVGLFAELETNICERQNLLNKPSKMFAYTGQVELILSLSKSKEMQEMSEDFWNIPKKECEAYKLSH